MTATAPKPSPETMALVAALRETLMEREAKMRADFDAKLAVRDAQIAELRENRDGAALMQGAYGAVVSANLAAIGQALDTLEHKRALLVDGEPSAFLAKVLA